MPKTTYVWDELSDNVIEEYEDGVLSASYAHEPGLYGNLLSQNRNGVTSYYHYDGRGDTVALTDDSGNVTDTKEYDAWGNVIASTGSTVTPYLFGGEYGYQRDEATFVRNRVFHEFRWLSVDPLLHRNTRDAYVFCESNPVNILDPTGLVGITFFDAAENNRLNCRSKEGGVAFRFSVDGWPCQRGVTEAYFVQKLEMEWDWDSCLGNRRCKGSAIVYEYFNVSKIDANGPLKPIYSIDDHSLFGPPGGSFLGFRGYINHSREVRFYCMAPTGRGQRPAKKDMLPNEVPTVEPVVDGGGCLETKVEIGFLGPQVPAHWSRSTGYDLPVGIANWSLGFHCCRCDRSCWVEQTFRPNAKKDR